MKSTAIEGRKELQQCEAQGSVPAGGAGDNRTSGGNGPHQDTQAGAVAPRTGRWEAPPLWPML